MSKHRLIQGKKKEHNSEYRKKLTKIGLLVEILFRKYTSELTKD